MEPQSKDGEVGKNMERNDKLNIGDMCIYCFEDTKGKYMLSLVQIENVYDVGANVKVLKNYYDTEWGFYKYLASKNLSTNASKCYLYNIQKFIKNKKAEKLCDFINDIFGCDAMYYGIDSYGISLDICGGNYGR